jgi:RNA polymerase sigma factor (sigma-70 family)
MHSPSLQTAVRRIRSLTASLPDNLSDRELLTRFLATRDEPAFAALVARHGPAVLGVCRRILSDRHAAEDAFQATFLVLARRAAAIRKSASVGCWLYGVAFRVATRLKTRLARRPHPANLPDVSVDPRDEVTWRDVRRVLDEEVNRLPDRLRLPVLLCYFEGKTRDEAADALGWKVTTLRGRLEDARQRLRTRLALRGVELSAALLAVATADAFAIENTLIESTLRAATGSASRAIQSLANGVAMSGVIGKLKLSAAAMVVAVGLGSTLLVYRGEAGQAAGPGPAAKTPDGPAKRDEPPPAKPLAKADDWGESAGEFRLRLKKPTVPIKAGDSPELKCDLKYTGKEKRSVFCLPENAAIELDGRWYQSHGEGSFAGRSDDLAPDTEHSAWLAVRPDSQWVHLRDKPDDPSVREAISFRLAAGTHTLRVAYRLAKDVRAVSNAVTIEVASDGWGEPAGGLKARLRIAKTRVRPGDPLQFELDLKNEGRQSLTVDAFSFGCAVLLDGERYTYQGPIDSKANPKELKPGSEMAPFVTVTADDLWQARRPKNPAERELGIEQVHFRLAPGKHTVQVAYPIDKPKIQPVSNAVEIEVVAAPLDLATQERVLSADRIWVVPSPTRDKPIPMAEQVLKGPPRDRPTVFDLRLLPGDDSTKKWIVFLQAQEDWRTTVPEVKRSSGSEWYVPYDEPVIDAIRQALMPVAWGPEKDRLRMGIRMRNDTVRAESPVVVEVVIRNSGNDDRTLKQHRYNIYDYWPGIRFEVVAPDGSKWVISKPTGAMDEADMPKEIPLKPGDMYIHAVRPDLWPAFRQDPRGEQGLANLFVTPGKYSVACRYAPIPVIGEAGWEAGIISNSVTFTVTTAEPKTGAWGDAVNGLRARVRLPKEPIKAGGLFEFDFDLRNDGDKPRALDAYSVLCDVEIDGVRYAYLEKDDLKGNPRTIKPRDELSPFVSVLPEMWRKVKSKPGEPDGIAHALTPGKHKLVASYILDATTRVTAPAIEIEVRADEWGEVSGGMKARLRLKKPTFRAGEPLAFELDLKNTGDKTYEDGPVPYHCRIELDGAEYRYTAPLSYLTATLKIAPGKEFVPYVKVTTDQWWMHTWNNKAVPLTLTPGKHKVRVSYPVSAKDEVNPVSQTVEFEVKPEAAGAEIKGVRARLSTEKTNWKAGESPILSLELTNEGKRRWAGPPSEWDLRLEFDGVWYEIGKFRGGGIMREALSPGSGWTKWLDVHVDKPSGDGNAWLLLPSDDRVAEPQKLKLTPGKHKVRVAYLLTERGEFGMPLHASGARVESNAVEIEIERPD